MTKTALAVALGDENWGKELAGGEDKEEEIVLSHRQQNEKLQYTLSQ